jgi:hypothetical protein
MERLGYEFQASVQNPAAGAFVITLIWFALVSIIKQQGGTVSFDLAQLEKLLQRDHAEPPSEPKLSSGNRIQLQRQ